METKKIINYDFAKEYSQFPGGRFIKLGEYSGEDFRDTVLREIFESDKSVIIDATGVKTSFSPSFLDECFGELAKEYGLEIFNQKVEMFSDTNPKLSEKMDFYVRKAVNAAS